MGVGTGVIGLLFVAWLVDQAFTWMERRGWIYWKGTSYAAGRVAHTLRRLLIF